MGAIIDFFTGIADTVISLVDYMISTIQDIVYMIGLLGKVILSLPELIGWLPAGIISIVATAFSIVVIYKVIGREG